MSSFLANRRRAAGFACTVIFFVSGSCNLQAQQDWSITIRGTVVDTLTRKPIAGAIVDLNRDPPSRRSSSLPAEGDSGQEKLTDWMLEGDPGSTPGSGCGGGTRVRLDRNECSSS